MITDRIVNVTAHAITFQDADGIRVTIPPSGTVINARAEERVVEECDGITFVATSFVGDDAGRAAIAAIKTDRPDALIVGSVVAAQAYAPHILAMVPVTGFERALPAEKRMRLDRFTRFDAVPIGAIRAMMMTLDSASYDAAVFHSVWFYETGRHAERTVKTWLEQQ